MPRIIEPNELQNNKVSFGFELISSVTKLPPNPRNMNCRNPTIESQTFIRLPIHKYQEVADTIPRIVLTVFRTTCLVDF